MTGLSYDVDREEGDLMTGLVGNENRERVWSTNSKKSDVFSVANSTERPSTYADEEGWKNVPLHAGATLRGTVFNVLNTTVGAGILSLPFAMNLAGYIGGCVLLFAVGLSATVAAWYLLKAMDIVKKYSYHEVAEHFWGGTGANIVSFTISLLNLGGCAAMIVLIGDMIPPALKELGCGDFLGNRNAVTLILAGVVIFPLASLRKLDALSHVSLVALLCIMFFVATVVTQYYTTAGDDTISGCSCVEPSWEFNDEIWTGCAVTGPFDSSHTSNSTAWGPSNPVERWCPVEAGSCEGSSMGAGWDRCVRAAHPWPTSGADAVRSVPLLFFGFLCHFNIPSLYNEMRRQARHDVPSRFSHKINKMMVALAAAFSVAMVWYQAVAFYGTYAFGMDVQDNVMKDLRREHFSFIPWLKLLYGAVCVSSVPLASYGVRSSLHRYTVGVEGQEPTQSQLVWQGAVVVALPCVIALAVGSNVSIVFGLTGATTASLVMYVFPALFYLNATKPESEMELAKRLLQQEAEGGGGGHHMLLTEPGTTFDDFKWEEGEEDEEEGGGEGGSSMVRLGAHVMLWVGLVVGVVSTAVEIYDIVA